MTSELEAADQADETTTPSLPPIPFAGGLLEPDAALEFTAENVPCLRACRYYMVLKAHFEHQNPAGTFEPGSAPMQSHHYCSAIGGTEPLELSADAPVYECNRWDPNDPQVVELLAERRRQYMEQRWQTTPPTNTEGHDDTAATGDGPQ